MTSSMVTPAAGIEVIGADAAADLHARRALGGVERMADQLLGARPVEPAAALRRVHRFGDAEAEVPQIMAKRDGPLPVDGRVEPRIDVGERIGDHMRGRIGDAVESRSLPFFGTRSARRWRRAALAVLGRQRNRRHGALLKA